VNAEFCTSHCYHTQSAFSSEKSSQNVRDWPGMIFFLLPGHPFGVGSGTHAGRGPRPLFPISLDLTWTGSFQITQRVGPIFIDPAGYHTWL
jgi:hypothetical protein